MRTSRFPIALAMLALVVSSAFGFEVQVQSGAASSDNRDFWPFRTCPPYSHNLGAEVREQHDREWSRSNACEFNDPNASKRATAFGGRDILFANARVQALGTPRNRRHSLFYLPSGRLKVMLSPGFDGYNKPFGDETWAIWPRRF